MRSGIVYLIGAGPFRHAGQVGYVRSSRGASSNLSSGTDGPGAYFLEISYTSNVVNPSQGPYHRLYGFPLRCLSTVLDM